MTVNTTRQEFKILMEDLRNRRGKRRKNSRIKTLNFRKSDFNKLGELVGRIPCKASLSGKGAQKSWLYFKEVLLRAYEQTLLLQWNNEM